MSHLSQFCLELHPIETFSMQSLYIHEHPREKKLLWVIQPYSQIKIISLNEFGYYDYFGTDKFHSLFIRYNDKYLYEDIAEWHGWMPKFRKSTVSSTINL